MTVILHFSGGPGDGGWRRTAHRDHEKGWPIICRAPRGYYTSIAPWDGLENHVDLEWFYGTPELHEKMKDKV